MKREKGLKKFKLMPRYDHHRSDGTTKRQNGGTRAIDRVGDDTKTVCRISDSANVGDIEDHDAEIVDHRWIF